MILYSRFGISAGRLGNGIMQLMTMTAFSKKYNCEFQVPRWKYSEYFENPPNQYDVEPPYKLTVKEDHFHFTPLLWDQYADDFRSRNVNIFGWLQSYKYWEHYKEEVYKALKFKDSFIEATKAKMDQKIYEKPIIAISIRQGADYADNPNYELIPIKFYIMALLEHFPDFRENYNLLLFSDEPNYCKLHFDCLKNVWYTDHLSDIEQMCLMSTQCKHFIIANSTFSWCGAKLGEKEDSIVVCPNFLFKGTMSVKNDFRDFYCDHWKKLDHKIKRIDLKNTTFTIPVFYDTRDRRQNVDLNIKYLRENFDTNITVGEQAGPDFAHVKDIVDYRHFDGMNEFHRTKMLNDMASDAKTPVVVNWDGDVIVPPMQIVEAVRAIIEDKQEMVYPYDGRFARVPREHYHLLNERVDVGCLKGLMYNGMRPSDALSVGGAIFWDSLAFLRCGMENENMVSYGPEDAERYDRADKLGVRIHRIKGVLYHVDHIISVNSSMKNPKYPDNVQELEKIRSLNKQQLESYIDTWEWARKYTPSYYESIFEESVKSRDAVFKILQQTNVLSKGMRVVDVGCGLGQWGFEAKQKFDIGYMGIDFGVPQHKLKIPEEQYIDHDLREPIIPGCTKFDLAICMEVGEHLPKKSADQLLDTLCSLSDTILFSAAIPGQGGIDHLNEQWQSWWSTQFIARGYYPNDYRALFLRNEDIAIWYQQNSIIYTRGTTILNANDRHHLPKLDFIHPQMYMNLMKHYRILK